MAKLINGDGNKAIYSDQDADLIASICGNVTCIAAVGGEYAATQEDANTIGLADGVIITKEGRRIQLDTGYTDLFDIPTGTTGVTNYYIIGYHLYINDDNAQVCETFVRKMNSSTETITEDTFKGGATEVYVSVYRVTQVGLNISTISLLLAKLSNISKIKSDLDNVGLKLVETVSSANYSTWGALAGALNTAFTGLSSDRKRQAKLVLVTGTTIRVYNVNLISNGEFTHASVGPTEAGIATFRLSGSKYYSVAIYASSTTFTDMSSSASSGTLSLYA